MKTLKKFLSYFGAFILGGFVALVLGFCGACYYAAGIILDSQSKAENLNVNPNIKEVVLLATQYAEELGQFDQIQQKLLPLSMDSICKNICSSSSWQMERYKNERVKYLAEYSKVNGSMALKDPAFVLRMEEMNLLAELFPFRLRNIFLEAQKSPLLADDPNIKFKLTLQLVPSLLLTCIDMAIHQKDFNKKLKHVNFLRNLNNECKKGTSPRKIQRECENFATH